MAFSDVIRQQVKRLADFTCCWCTNRNNTVEVHHIIPRAEGGPDVFENAAPLCPSCHDLYGGNPEKRKEITSRRNHWYETCAAKNSWQWPVSSRLPLMMDFDFERHSYAAAAGIPRSEFEPRTIKLSSGDNALEILFGAGKSDDKCMLVASISLPFGLGFNVAVTSISEIAATRFVKALRGQTEFGQLVETESSSYASDDISLIHIGDGPYVLALGTHTASLSPMGVQCLLTEDVALAVAKFLDSVDFAGLVPPPD